MVEVIPQYTDTSEVLLSMPYDVREHIIKDNNGIMPRSVRPGVPLLLLPDAPPGGFVREFFIFTIIESDECIYLKVDIPPHVFNSAMPKINLELPLKWDPRKNEMLIYREQTISDDVVLNRVSHIIAGTFGPNAHVHSLLSTSNKIIVTRVANI